MTSQALIRPAWTPATIALMIGGFMLFWPLGLAVLAYIIWGERLEGFRHDVNRSTDRFFGGLRRGAGPSPFAARGTGNVAFDEWRAAEIARLDAERRRLNETFAEFEAYDRELRRAKDQEAFERFMANRRAPSSANTDGPTIDV